MILYHFRQKFAGAAGPLPLPGRASPKWDPPRAVANIKNPFKNAITRSPLLWLLL